MISQQHSSVIAPSPLRRGDAIGVIAPSSPQRDDERLKSGIRYFESLGYRVICGEHLWKRYGYLAGTDQERLDDLNAMIRNPAVKMIIAGRGGYGMSRILSKVDYRSLRRSPKIIVGFSDVTALNLALLRKCNLVSFSGAMPGVDFWNPEEIDPFAEEWFWRSVTWSKPLGIVRQPGNFPIAGLQSGTAEGRLLAGNLTLLANLVGTPYLPSFNNALLLIEEIGEEAYRVDRLLSQLDNAGVLRKISGLLFGQFTNAKPTRVSVEPLPMEEVFSEYIRRAGKPALGNLLYGHIPTKLTLPIGVKASIDGKRGVFTILEAGVQ